MPTTAMERLLAPDLPSLLRALFGCTHSRLGVIYMLQYLKYKYKYFTNRKYKYKYYFFGVYEMQIQL